MEHINQAALRAELSIEQQQHLSQCAQCQENQALLQQLASCASDLALEAPPANVWQRIEQSRTSEQTQSASNKWRNLSATAAMLIVGMFGWLSWNNYQLQQQFTQLLAANMALESQLVVQQSISYPQAHIFSQLEAVEQQLVGAQSLQKKLVLLQQRQQYINQIIKLQRGNNNEYYI